MTGHRENSIMLIRGHQINGRTQRFPERDHALDTAECRIFGARCCDDAETIFEKVGIGMFKAALFTSGDGV